MSSSSTSLDESQQIRKFPYRRLQQTVSRFIKVLQIDIERLDQHKYNIEKYTRYNDLRLLNREHINASRTVQQLKANLIELDRSRLQVEDQDLHQFDSRTLSIRQDANKVLSDFMEMCSVEQAYLKLKHSESIERQSSSPPRQNSSGSSDFEEMPNHNEVLQMQHSDQLESDLEVMLEAEQSWSRLQNDVNDLHGLMLELGRLVHDQQEQVDSIEDHIDHSLSDVQQANTHLARAAKYKAALYPLTGALVGCVVGGPVGLVAGLKLGVAAAVGGGLIGATGGGMMKRYSNKQTEMIELKNQTQSTSKSCPAHLDKIK